MAVMHDEELHDEYGRMSARLQVQVLSTASIVMAFMCEHVYVEDWWDF
jgi:hypothetical protein